MALLTLFLLALSKERWLWAMSLALLLGFTRPIAVPIAAVTVVALWCRWRARSERPLVAHRDRRRASPRSAGCGVSGLLWPAIAGAVTGQANAYTVTMAAWRGEPRDRAVQAVARHVALLLRPDLGAGLAHRALRRHRRDGARAVGVAARPAAAHVVAWPTPHTCWSSSTRSRRSSATSSRCSRSRRCSSGRPATRAGAPGNGGRGSGSACCSSPSWSASGTGSTSSGGSSRRPTSRRRRRPAQGQRPSKTGFSLARNASTAARWSALAPVRVISSASWARAVSRSVAGARGHRPADRPVGQGRAGGEGPGQLGDRLLEPVRRHDLGHQPEAEALVARPPCGAAGAAPWPWRRRRAGAATTRTRCRTTGRSRRTRG